MVEIKQKYDYNMKWEFHHNMHLKWLMDLLDDLHNSTYLMFKNLKILKKKVTWKIKLGCYIWVKSSWGIADYWHASVKLCWLNYSLLLKIIGVWFSYVNIGLFLVTFLFWLSENWLTVKGIIFYHFWRHSFVSGALIISVLISYLVSASCKL